MLFFKTSVVSGASNDRIFSLEAESKLLQSLGFSFEALVKKHKMRRSNQFFVPSGGRLFHSSNCWMKSGRKIHHLDAEKISVTALEFLEAKVKDHPKLRPCECAVFHAGGNNYRIGPPFPPDFVAELKIALTLASLLLNLEGLEKAKEIRTAGLDHLRYDFKVFEEEYEIASVGLKGINKETIDSRLDALSDAPDPIEAIKLRSAPAFNAPLKAPAGTSWSKHIKSLWELWALKASQSLDETGRLRSVKNSLKQNHGLSLDAMASPEQLVALFEKHLDKEFNKATKDPSTWVLAGGTSFTLSSLVDYVKTYSFVTLEDHGDSGCWLGYLPPVVAVSVPGVTAFIRESTDLPKDKATLETALKFTRDFIKLNDEATLMRTESASWGKAIDEAIKTTKALIS